MQKSACILSRSRGNGTKRHTNLDMSLVSQWKEVTFLATFFGLHGQQNNPSGTLMPGKMIGCGWTNVLAMAPLGIEHFFDAFCFNPQRPWGQPQSKLWASLPCRVSKNAYLENMHVSSFLLTPRRIPVERKAFCCYFFIWMLHGSTKVVVRAVALSVSEHKG